MHRLRKVRLRVGLGLVELGVVCGTSGIRIYVRRISSFNFSMQRYTWHRAHSLWLLQVPERRLGPVALLHRTLEIQTFIDMTARVCTEREDKTRMTLNVPGKEGTYIVAAAVFDHALKIKRVHAKAKVPRHVDDFDSAFVVLLHADNQLHHEIVAVFPTA